ncbi:TonB-dependent receptor [Novosphingobium sp. Rr 2-17]|uniref:TonB-dependent receptor n=1 Tax=Novosphingobium sp. Rr 2-17 TaxID=555793 RepID=UPI0012F65688|nr:TonB-dependent receptor [Novosphingobium sp. Rr 2-17]
MKLKLVHFLMASAVGCSSAHAQDAEAGSDAAASTEGENIVVTAARTKLPASALPLTVHVIGSEDLSRQVAVSGTTVAAVSALLPAFSPPREKDNSTGETLRGRSILYTIDGVPQSTPIRDSARDSHTIDPFFIDRVEVIYGSNALQGIGATGGVINQVTVLAPTKDGVSGRALVQGNTGDNFSGASMGGKAGALLSYRTGVFDVTGGAVFERRGVYLDGHDRHIGIDSNRSELQDTDSLSFFGRVGIDLSSNTRLEVIGSRYNLKNNNHYVAIDGNRDEGITATSERGDVEGEPASTLSEMISASLTDKDLGGGTLTLQGFFNRSKDTFSGGTLATYQDTSIAPKNTLFDQSQNRSRKLGGKISYERPVPGISDLNAIVGLDALFDRTAQTLIQTNRTWVPRTTFRSLAPFGQLNWGLFGGVIRLAGGVRYENVQLDVPTYTTLAYYGSNVVYGGKPSFERALWNGGVVFEPVKGIRAYGSYSEGYTIPDVGRILRSISKAGVHVSDYIDLTPVVSNNREIGVEIARGPVKASASYYWSSSKLGEVLERGDDGIYTTSRQPIDIQGLDLNIVTQTPVPGLKVTVGYSHVVGRTDDDGDGKLDEDLDGANISPDRLNLSANYAHGPLAAGIQGRFYLSRTFDGQDEVNNFSGYKLFDAYVSYDFDFGQVGLSVENLTDAYYVTYYSDTQGPTDNARFYSGRGRNFTLRWNYRF